MHRKKQLDPDTIIRTYLGRSLEEIIREAFERLGVLQPLDQISAQAAKQAATEYDWQQKVLGVLQASERSMEVGQKKDLERLSFDAFIKKVLQEVYQDQRIEAYLKEKQTEALDLEEALARGQKEDEGLKVLVQQLVMQHAQIQLIQALALQAQQSYQFWSETASRIQKAVETVQKQRLIIQDFRSDIQERLTDLIGAAKAHTEFANALQQDIKDYQDKDPEVAKALADWQSDSRALAQASEKTAASLASLDKVLEGEDRRLKDKEKDLVAQKAHAEEQQQKALELQTSFEKATPQMLQVLVGAEESIENNQILKQAVMQAVGDIAAFRDEALESSSVSITKDLDDVEDLGRELWADLKALKALEEAQKQTQGELRELLQSGIGPGEKKAFMALYHRNKENAHEMLRLHEGIQHRIERATGLTQKVTETGPGGLNPLLTAYQHQKKTAPQPKERAQPSAKNRRGSNSF